MRVSRCSNLALAACGYSFNWIYAYNAYARASIHYERFEFFMGNAIRVRCVV